MGQVPGCLVLLFKYSFFTSCCLVHSELEKLASSELQLQLAGKALPSVHIHLKDKDGNQWREMLQESTDL